jgi:predicted DNA-binding protein (UPF0251 family)
MSGTLGWTPHDYTPEELARGDALTAEFLDWAKRSRAPKAASRATLDAEYASLLERERAFRQEHAGKSMPAERILAPTYPTLVQAAFDALRADYRAWLERLGPRDRVHDQATRSALRRAYLGLWERWLEISHQFEEVEWDLPNLVPWDPVCALWHTTQRILAVGHKVRPDRVLDELSQAVEKVTQAGAAGLGRDPPPAADPRKATPRTASRAVRAVQRWIRRSLGEPGALPVGQPQGMPTQPKSQRKRRRRANRKQVPLTGKQLEAVELVGVHKGNFAAAARAAGKSRQALQSLYEKAMKKMGRSASVLKAKTQRLPEDRRGQVNLAAPEE